MIKTFRIRSTFVTALAAMAIASAARAQCVNPQDAAASPASGVEVYFDIHLPNGSAEGHLFRQKDPYQWPKMAALNHYGLAAGHRLATASYDDDWKNSIDTKRQPFDDLAGFFDVRGQGFGDVNVDSDGRPPEVWANGVDPVRLDRKKLRPEGGAVFFYEPDGRGGRRLCRMERWLSRSLSMVWSDKKGAYAPIPRPPAEVPPASPKQTRNPTLAALSKDYYLIGYANLRYDAQGLLPHVGPVCFYYNARRQVEWVGYETPKGDCNGKKPDPKKESFIEVLFDEKEQGIGAVLTRPERWKPDDELSVALQTPRGGSREGWYQYWEFRYGGGKVSATTDDRVGVRSVSTTGSLGAKDDDPVYTDLANYQESKIAPRRGQGGRRHYEFPQPVSPDVLRKPEFLYQLDRVRIAGGAVRIFERFAAGGSQRVNRVWMLPNGNAARQEFFDKGRLVKAIAVDFVEQDPEGLYWIEDLAQYKDQIKVPFENIYLRLYQYDTSGKESLAAIGWTDFPRDEFYDYHSGRTKLLRDYKDKVAQLLGRKQEAKKKVPQELTYFYGTPDGQVKWPEYDAFAKMLYPDGARGLDVVFPTGRRSSAP